jgi:hypothetical protein
LAAPAGADPARPTDHRSEVVDVAPPVDGLEVRVVGGDAFLELRAPAGAVVLVPGYQAEPYLRFDPDGTVHENRRSPTAYLNQDRYGAVAPPAHAVATAEPDWVEVAGDGRYAWHDHRIHWMAPGPPPGRQPGDRILEAVVPLQVDGTTVEVTVVSTWLPGPSPAPALAGAALGLVAVAAGARWRGAFGVSLAAGLVAAAAAGVAAVALWSVPPETDPERSHLLIAVIAVAAAGLGLARPTWRVPLVLVAGVELALWSFLRRQWLVRAVLPTDVPFWFDRAVTGAVAVTGVALVAWAVAAGALGPIRPVRPAPTGPGSEAP